MSTIEIKNRFTGAVIFSCELSADVAARSRGAQIGFAVRKAIRAGVDLSRADLTGADLSGADLSGADLRGADLSGANLAGANLTRTNLTRTNLAGANLDSANLAGANLDGADLTHFRQDMITEILRLPDELDALRVAITAGKIDGSQYSGKCCCLAGTLAKAHGIKPYFGADIPTSAGVFRARASSPRERWFSMIRSGDTPETNPASRLALEWVDEAIAIRDAIRRMV